MTILVKIWLLFQTLVWFMLGRKPISMEIENATEVSETVGASNEGGSATSDDQVSNPGTQTELTPDDGANAAPPVIRVRTTAHRERNRVALYKAAVEGNWEDAEKIINDNPGIDHAGITPGSYTALQIAAGAQHVDLVKRLMDRSGNTIGNLRQPNGNGNNAFCIAASAGSVEIAKDMLLRDRTLLTTRGSKQKLPIHFAAWFGCEEMVKYLYSEHRRAQSEEDLYPVFLACVQSGLFGIALTMLDHHPEFALGYDNNDKTALHLLAQRPSTFAVRTPARNTANKLLEGLLSAIIRQEEENSLSNSAFLMHIRSPSHVLFDAVKSGNSELVVKLIELFPGLIWEKDDKNWSIIHAAVSYRDATVFNLVHKIGFFKDVIVDFKDSQNGDTLLHLAARLAPASELNKLPGAAIQMQRELLWFEEVKRTMHAADTVSRNGVEQISQEGSAANLGSAPEAAGVTHYEVSSSQQRNATALQEVNMFLVTISPQPSYTLQEGITPQELFTSQHELLLKEGRKWMNGTAQSCTIVSTLIAGALFAAGISVSVGENHPIERTSEHILKKKAYRIFIISNAMAFLSALAATLTFLAILTSHYAERDFLKSLPSKLIFGLVVLFFSIIAMMVTFGAGFIIAYGDKDFLPVLVIGCAVVPVLLYVYLQRRLLKDVLSSAFSSKYLFKN